MPGGVPDPQHDLGAGHDGGDQRTAAQAAFLGDREAGGEQDRPRMHPAAGQVVWHAHRYAIYRGLASSIQRSAISSQPASPGRDAVVPPSVLPK